MRPTVDPRFARDPGNSMKDAEAVENLRQHEAAVSVALKPAAKAVAPLAPAPVVKSVAPLPRADEPVKRRFVHATPKKRAAMKVTKRRR